MTGPHEVIRVITERPRESRIFVGLTLYGESKSWLAGCPDPPDQRAGSQIRSLPTFAIRSSAM